jgi:hypothetical protein
MVIMVSLSSVSMPGAHLIRGPGRRAGSLAAQCVTTSITTDVPFIRTS